jgi:hypothetical protein
MVQHASLNGTELHYPRGTSQSGVALDLASSATAYQITDASAHGYLTINTSDSPPSVVWGNTSGDANAQPTYRHYIPDNVSNAWRVSDEGALDYISVTTTNSSEMITLGNATTNPKLTWTGSGAWSVGGGYGSSGQVLTSNGSSAAPTWQAITSAGTSSGTSANNYEVNNDASIAVSATTGSLTISSNDGAGSPTAWNSTLTQATSGPLVLSTVANGVNNAPTLILGLDSTSAAGTSVLKLSAADGGTQRTASLTWTASTQVLTVSPVTSFSLAPTAPGGSSSERWGATAQAAGISCTSLGYGAVAGHATTGDESTAVGTLASAAAHRATAVGKSADAAYNDTFVGGQSAAATAAGGVIIGRASSGGASVVLNGTDSGTSGRFVVGRATGPVCPIDTVLIGRGDLADTTATTLTWRTTNATGTNINGTDQTWDASRGTGTGTGGYMRWRVSVPGASGSTLGTLTEIMRLDGGASGGTGKIGFFSKAATPAAQQATPVTLADVIALLQAYGLSA